MECSDNNEVQEGQSDEDSQSVMEEYKIERIHQENENQARKISVDRLPQLIENTNVYFRIYFILLQNLFESVEQKLNELVKAAEEYASFLIKRLSKQDDEDDGSQVFLTQQPSILKGGELKDYQLTSLNWMISLYECGLNGILADEMGLGKTIQAISLIGFLRQFRGIHKHFLIVAPKSTLGNWMREFAKWLPQCKVVKLVAVVEERSTILEEYIVPGKFDVCLTTFQGVNKCYKYLKRFQFKYLIVDEAHQLKNDESLNHQLLKTINSKYKLFLTGTPLQNKPHELWSLLNFLFPELFKSSEIFDQWFQVQNPDNQQNISTELFNRKNIDLVNKFHRILRLFMLRRSKADVLNTLPPKKEIHLFINLSPQQIKMYQNILLNVPHSESQESKTSWNNRLMQLRKVCLHPYVFPEVEDASLPELGEHLIEASGKMRFLDVFLKILHSEGHQVLIFSQFTSLLNILEDYCIYRNYEYCRIDGNTELEVRDQQIDDFVQLHSKKFIFLLSTRAGGLGINLASADTVILYDSDFNPQMDIQAMDRVHRIGQKNPVKVYRLISKNTIEEQIVERQQVKLRWDQLIINYGGRPGNKAIISKDEWKNIINFGAQKIFSSNNDWNDDDVNRIIAEGEQRTDQMNERIKQQIDQADQTNIDLGLKTINVFNYFSQRNENADTNIVNAKVAELQGQMKSENKRNQREKKILDLEQYLPEINIEYYQLYSKRDKIIELQLKENLYITYKNLQKDNITINQIQEPLPLTEKENKKLVHLYKSGFPDMTEKKYKEITQACEKLGRNKINEIAELTFKDPVYIQSYLDALFERGEQYPMIATKINKIIKSEENIARLIHTQQLAVEFFGSFGGDLDKMKFNQSIYKPYKSHLFTEYTDCLIIKGITEVKYGNWTKLRDYLLSSCYFDSMDLYLSSITENEIKIRVKQLIKILNYQELLRLNQQKMQQEEDILNQIQIKLEKKREIEQQKQKKNEEKQEKQILKEEKQEKKENLTEEKKRNKEEKQKLKASRQKDRKKELKQEKMLKQELTVKNETMEVILDSSTIHNDEVKSGKNSEKQFQDAGISEKQDKITKNVKFENELIVEPVKTEQLYKKQQKKKQSSSIKTEDFSQDDKKQIMKK